MNTPELSIDDLDVRDVRASTPSPGEEAMRDAYLGLLKLCLCDLEGSGTSSVGQMQDGRMFCRELRGEETKPRALGMDWPLHGLTMVGLPRLDDLQACVERVVAEGVQGDLIEAGAWRGGASILMRATLDSIGASDRLLWVADSFQGFPTPDDENFPEDSRLKPLSAVDFLAVPVEEVKEHFARFGFDSGVRFVEGFFEDTLPRLRDRRWSLVRLDGDSYEATRHALESLYAGLSRGGYLIIDDYLVEECRQAVDDFRRENDVTEPIEQIDWVSVRWRREDEPAGGETPPSKESVDIEAEPSTRLIQRHDRDIPTLRELGLGEELEATREDLEAARQRVTALEAEVEQLRRSPLRRIEDRIRGGAGGPR